MKTKMLTKKCYLHGICPTNQVNDHTVDVTDWTTTNGISSDGYQSMYQDSLMWTIHWLSLTV